MSDTSASHPPLDIDDVRHVATLARLAIPHERLAQLQRELVAILGHIEQLQLIDTAALEPMAHPLTLSNRLGDDLEVPGMPIADLLRSAPATEGCYLVVPKVLGGESA